MPDIERATRRLELVRLDSPALATLRHQLVDLGRVLRGLIDDLDDLAAALSAITADIDTDDHPAAFSVNGLTDGARTEL